MASKPRPSSYRIDQRTKVFDTDSATRKLWGLAWVNFWGRTSVPGMVTKSQKVFGGKKWRPWSKVQVDLGFFIHLVEVVLNKATGCSYSQANFLCF